MSVPVKKPTILETIYARRAEDVQLAKTTPGTTPADIEGLLASNVAPSQIPLVERLKRTRSLPALMAEIKRASPSKGAISLTANPAQQALAYALSGASVISVLTEPTWFKGSLLDLRLARQAVDALPDRPAILRKEFILDEYQIAEARLHGADTVLLIVAMLTPTRLAELYKYSLSLSMEPLVEVNNAVEMKTALDLGAKVIGVNNRNLHDFQVDMGTTSRLVEMVRERDVILCALSGIAGPKDVQLYRDQGVRAVLVGEALMRAPDTSLFIRELLEWPDEVAETKDEKPWVQFSGITSVEQATAYAKTGVDLIGLIFDSTNPRHIALPVAAQISTVIHSIHHASSPHPINQKSRPWFANQKHLLISSHSRPLVVGIFRNALLADIIRTVTHVPLDLVQLDGEEPAGWARHIPAPIIRTFRFHAAADTNISTPGLHAFARFQITGTTEETITTELAWAKGLMEAQGYPLPLIIADGKGGVASAAKKVGAWAVDIEAGEDNDVKTVRDLVQAIKGP